MAEIRLICPGCAAEYRLPGTAIPPEGREVECSACGNVWHAGPPPALLPPAGDLPGAPAAGDEPPRLSRRLPDTVLDILRDEVEHERRLRAAEDGAPPLPARSPVPPRAPVDPEWPATTITTAITPDGEPRQVELAPRPRVEPARPRPALAAQVEPAMPLPQAESPLPDQAPAAPEQVPVQAPASRPPRARYATGFGLAAMLAAACLTLYLLAPALSGQGALGEGLMQFRGQVDEARLWLQDRATGLTR